MSRQIIILGFKQGNVNFVTGGDTQSVPVKHMLSEGLRGEYLLTAEQERELQRYANPQTGTSMPPFNPEAIPQPPYDE